MEILTGILKEPGRPTRKLKVMLGFRLCKQLGLNGSHGDFMLVSRTLGIGRSFAKRIVLCSIDGKEEDLFVRKPSSRCFLNTEWHHKLDEFAFRPENARSIPGKKKTILAVKLRYNG